MSLKKVHGEQPKEFKFSTENLKKVEEILKRYPEKNKNKFIASVFGLSSIVLYASEIYGSWRAVRYYQPKK